jgi:hypothetical protein
MPTTIALLSGILVDRHSIRRWIDSDREDSDWDRDWNSAWEDWDWDFEVTNDKRPPAYQRFLLFVATKSLLRIVATPFTGESIVSNSNAFQVLVKHGMQRTSSVLCRIS